MPSTSVAWAEDRREDRTEVHLRTSATGPTGGAVPVLVVDISPSGLMGRCDTLLTTGDPIVFRLPSLPPLSATIRWALGGRIGCEFDRSIAPAAFYSLIGRLRR